MLVTSMIRKLSVGSREAYHAEALVFLFASQTDGYHSGSFFLLFLLFVRRKLGYLYIYVCLVDSYQINTPSEVIHHTFA